MNLTFHWINILILIGACNALVFCIILLFQKRHPGSKYFAAFIFVFAYNGFETFNWSSGLDRYYMFFDLFGFIVIYAVGPSLYLYVTSLLYPEQKRTVGKLAVFYSPVIFQFVTRLAIIGYHFLWINKIIETKVHSMQLMNIVWFYSEPLSVLVFLACLVASISQFRRYRKAMPPKVKDKQKAMLRWINSLLLCLMIIGSAWVLTVIAPYVLSIPFDVHYYPIELGLVMFTYWVVLNGYHKVKLLSVKPLSATNGAFPEGSFEEYFAKLRNVMETEKRYLDPELNLGRVAAYTGIPAKTISAVLNQYQKTSFADFVNAYRVREVSERMINPTNRQFTISAMALDSGFNSQATFQRVFKNVTGMSPREYMSAHQKSTSEAPFS